LQGKGGCFFIRLFSLGPRLLCGRRQSFSLLAQDLGTRLVSILPYTLSCNSLPVLSLTTVQVFTDSAMKLHRHLLALNLAQLLLQQPCQDGGCDGAMASSQELGTVFPPPLPSLPSPPPPTSSYPESHVISLILNHWKRN